MRNNRINRKSIVGIFAILLLLLTIFSSVYIIVESEHECEGEGCPICHMIEVCEEILYSIGNTLSFWRACYRGSLLSFCPWGAFMYFFSPKKQCLHDFLCDSLVVKQGQAEYNTHRPLRQIKYSIIIIATLVFFALPLILWGRLTFLN